MVRLSGIAVAAALAVLAGTFSARAETDGYYVTGEGGAALLPDLHLKGTPGGTSHENFDAGYALGGAFGYDDGDGKRIELDSLYTLSNLSKLDGLSTNGHLRSTSVMVNGQIDLLHDTPITPYVGVGAGFADISARADGYSGHDWKPAYQAEAGLRDDLTNQVSLFGEYRFSQSEAVPLSNGIDTARQHFADHGLMAGLTYRLGGQ